MGAPMGIMIATMREIVSFVKRCIELRAYDADSAVSVDEFIKGFRTSKTYFKYSYLMTGLADKTKEGLVYLNKDKVKKYALKNIYILWGVMIAMLAIVDSLIYFFSILDRYSTLNGITILTSVMLLVVSLLSWFPARVLFLLRKVPEHPRR